ncbi:Serine/threonine-protein kinase tel1, partial [Coemansia erecta]
MAIEVLQSHKRAMEDLLQQTKVVQIDDNSASVDKTASNSSPVWTETEIETTTILLSKITFTVGEWSDIQRKERPGVLWEEYFNKSAQLLQGVNSPTAWTGRALNALAEFSERQCMELTEIRDSESSGAVRKQKARELAACQQQLSRATSSADSSRLRTILRRLEMQVKSDQDEHSHLVSSIGGFLRLAVWSFVKCLECCSTFDDSVYSLVSLIMTHARAPDLHSVLSSGILDGVPSHKLLPLSHQLCARLGTDSDAFHTVLAHLVRRMSIDYPYHMLYHLFALRNANRTSSSTDPSKLLRRTSSYIAQQAPESEKMEQRRSEAATSIIVGITANSPDLGIIVRAIEELCNMYIELAVAPVPEKYKSAKLEGRLIEFSSKLKIKKLVKNLPSNIPVLTAVPRAEAPRDYMCVPFISTIADGYTLAGGINLPKITRVMGTDGKRYKQLVKGKDDMRQDAIIEQLFQVINKCMCSSKRRAPELTSSSSSGLRVRTYQVVPLTKRCGVLQWVDDTVPLGDWFREKEAKYRPGAPAMAQLRSIVHNVHKDKAASVEQKLEVFETVCKMAPPVFRFFFYEYFYDSQSWFEHREVYIRSAAVSSIAGWVLGIGDRHLQNILMDRSTAEIVHIDLGIAFDLGKLLPIPEAVPFRLTREMIDGMGLLGLQGTFQNTCETALRVMRLNSRVVITILNVLKVDPLYMWSIIPLRIDKMNRTAGVYADELRDGARISSTPSDIGERDVLLAEETDAAAAEDENKEAWRSIIH